ncbi:hypothetical protein ENUP19_0121G0013 [Entamoeba nuttalli]|uniref:RRM Nup35-type domain-containing protein n=1 Tax=Entamoeba nuttalli TaxID=412467 RepID=A0ABQ0DIT7_9EUKA
MSMIIFVCAKQTEIKNSIILSLQFPRQSVFSNGLRQSQLRRTRSFASLEPFLPNRRTQEPRNNFNCSYENCVIIISARLYEINQIYATLLQYGNVVAITNWNNKGVRVDFQKKESADNFAKNRFISSNGNKYVICKVSPSYEPINPSSDDQVTIEQRQSLLQSIFTPLINFFSDIFLKIWNWQTE